MPLEARPGPLRWAVTLLGCVVVFFATVAVLSSALRCPPGSMCEAPAYLVTGVGLLMASIVVGFGTVGLAFRFLTRRQNSV